MSAVFCKRCASLALFALLTAWAFSGWPRFLNFPPEIREARAAAPVIESSDITHTNNTNTAARTISYPAYGNGDLIIQAIATDADVSHTAPSSGPNEETLQTIILDQSPNSSGPHLSVIYYIATAAQGSPGTLTWGFSGNETSSGETIVVPAGEFDSGTPIDAISTVGVQTGSTGATITMPSFDSVNAGGRVVAIGGIDSDPMDNPFSPAGWTDRAGLSGRDDGSQNTFVATRDAETTASETIAAADFGINTGDTAVAVGFIVNGPLNASPAAPSLHDIPFDNEKTGDSTPDFEFTGSDPDGTASIIYQIQIDDDSAFGSPLVNCESDAPCAAGGGNFTNTVTGGDTNPFNEGERMRFTPTTAMTAGVTYYWHVRAEDDSGSGGSGSYGDWATIRSVTYVSGIDPSEWFQTTDEQFDTGTLEGVAVSGGSVALGAAIEATGGTTDESSVEGYKLHIFTSNGTFEVTSGTGDADALVVAGGGGAGQSGGSGGGGGGGAGGLIFDSVGVSTGQYSVVVGAGGAGGTSAGDNGSNSSFNGLTAIGGGGGANGTATPNDGSDGGSGGGARGYEVGYGGSGTPGQGNDGGDSLNSGSGSPASGGGGAGSVGGDSSSSVAGNGGSGLDYSSTFGTGVGASGWFAGGGGGGSGSSGASGGTASAGGGAGGGPSTAGSNATANTGGGGGGGGSDNTNGGDGGSGVVIVRYPLAGATSGAVTSTVIDFSWVPDMDDWDEVTVHATTTNGSIEIDVLDENSADTGLGCTISGGSSSCTFDISSLDPAGDDTQIYLKATLTNSGGTPSLNDWAVSWKTVGGELTSDIVDSGGSSVSSPHLSMTTSTFSFDDQTATGTLGVASQKIRVNNTTANPEWTLTIAASTSTAYWDGSASDYDFNDPTASAGDGGDDDALGGQMTIDPSGGTITPQGGCSGTGLSLHGAGAFSEGVTDSITIITAADTADTSCYWDVTGIDISQTIPPEQEVDSYNIDMMITVTAV